MGVDITTRDSLDPVLRDQIEVSGYALWAILQSRRQRLRNEIMIDSV